VWAVIFETEIYFVILYYFIYRAYLGSRYVRRIFSFGPWLVQKKVGMRSSSPSGYSVGSHLYIFYFDIFTGCGPLNLSWYSVGSHLFLIYEFTGSYLLLTIWQLKIYLSVCFYFVRWITRFSRPEYVPLHVHSPRALSSRESELSVYAVLALHKHKVLNL
jgi:hypothetical protein